MTRTGSNSLADAALDVPRLAPMVQEGDVLLPRQSDHDPKTALEGVIQEPPRRDRVRANGVEADRGHLIEMAAKNLLGGVFVTLGAEGAVGHPSDGNLLVFQEDELPARGRPAAVDRLPLGKGNDVRDRGGIEHQSGKRH